MDQMQEVKRSEAKAESVPDITFRPTICTFLKRQLMLAGEHQLFKSRRVFPKNVADRERENG